MSFQNHSPRLCVVLFVLAFLFGCSGTQQPVAEFIVEADPEISSTETSSSQAPQKRPPMILACGYSVLLKPDTEIIVYDEDPARAMSLYDFNQDEHLTAWIERHPTGRGYAFRSLGDGREIGKQVSDLCFGNGDQAKDVINQIVIHDAPGKDASDALLGLLKQGITTHFLVDREGVIYQVLDPVHAAQNPKVSKDILNGSVYIGVVLSDVGRVRCEVNGVAVEGGEVTAAQYVALGEAVGGLRSAYPGIGEGWPVDGRGAMVKKYIGASGGLMLDFHVNKGTSQPACLDLARVLSSPP